MKILELYQSLLPDLLCFEDSSSKRVQRVLRVNYLGCRTYANVPGNCIDFLKTVGEALLKLVELGESGVEERSYTRALQLTYLLLVPRIADRATVLIEKRGRKTVFRAQFSRQVTTEVPRLDLDVPQVASAIIRAHILDPSKPLSRLLIAWIYGKGTSTQYEHLEKDTALMLELIDSLRAKSLDNKWLCLSIPCTCRNYEPINGGRGRISRDVVTTIRVLSIATIPLLCFVLGGVATITKSGIATIPELTHGVSKGLRKFFEYLYAAPLLDVVPVLEKALKVLYEEMNREKLIELLQHSPVKTMRLTAYLIATL